MMKVRRRLAGLAIIVMAWAAIACAEPISQLQPTGYANDFAQVLDPNTKLRIEDIARQLDEKAHAQIALVTVYGLEPILPDGKVGSFQREAVPLMQSGDYSKALLLVTSRVASVIAQDAGVQITGARSLEPIESPAEPERGLSGGAILALAIVAIIVLVTPPLRRLLFWVLFSMMMGGGRSRGGYGGGGGFGSGGGFGGFGGGSSGGGGASSS